MYLQVAEEKDLDTAKAEFRAAWKALKAKTSKDELAAAYRAMNIREQWVTRRTRLRAFEHAVGGKMQPQKAEADQADGKPHPQGYSLRLFHVGSVDKKPSPTGAGGW